MMAARLDDHIVSRPAGVQRLLRRALDSTPNSVNGTACAYCSSPAVHYIPLEVRDPDVKGASWKVNAAACGHCFARHAPRTSVSLEPQLARVLIERHQVDVEVYERPRARQTRRGR